MKKNNLTTAIVAGIAGVAGIASVSNAVNLNSDGVGQVLIYPYYTVNNGLDTLISVVNTTDETKAVKVRFLEGKNSRECLDFNLYMSPYDVWTAALTATTASAAIVGNHTGEPSAKIITADTSCIVPNYISATGQEFLPYAFDLTTGYDGLGRSLERCTEGHFEMIEMGVLTNAADRNAADHGNNGVPGNCGLLEAHWVPGNAAAKWCDDACDIAGGQGTNGTGNPGTDISAPTGGLFGSASLINVNEGIDVAYNADAIESFVLNIDLHTYPGNQNPDLSSGTADTSIVFHQGNAISSTWQSDNIQAVSALYMHNNVYGEYVLSDSIGAATEWVVTFPTKFAYVDSLRSAFGNNPPYEPFTDKIGTGNGSNTFQNDTTQAACESYAIGLWDQEEQVTNTPGGVVPPSPLPPGVDPSVPLFCWEANVVEFHNEAVADPTEPSDILGSLNTTHLVTQSSATPTYFDSGWVTISFNNALQFTDDNTTDTTYLGLPVTGFAIQRYVNGNLGGNTLANYAGLFAHRYSKSISSS